MNFRNVTAEQAAVEMGKPAENVSILAQYNVASKAQDYLCRFLHVANDDVIVDEAPASQASGLYCRQCMSLSKRPFQRKIINRA